MDVVVPAEEAQRFTEVLQTSQYHKDERDYKLTVHLVLAALLSERNLTDDRFPQLIAAVFRDATPDLDALGIGASDQEFIRRSIESGGVRNSMANLSGGRFGLAQFAWLPRAIDYEFGTPIAGAFRALVADSAPVSQRVDAFRDELYVVSQELEKRGGFLPNWRLFRVSLSFVAMVLAGYDVTQYTFYSKGALRHGYDRYAKGASWPQGTMGDVYAEVCTFIRAVDGALRRHGVPVEDLIDAQSFVWLSFGNAKKQLGPAAPTPPKAIPMPAVDPESVAKDLAAQTFWPLDRARRLVSLVLRWRQVLFQGPPGTGKTFVAETLARLLAGDDEGRLEVVQFHPSYAYEDFIEGIRPRVTEGSNLAYEIRKGVFMRLADQAREFPGEPFFLVIDELNRANLPRVFGELLYALEYRGPQHVFRLPYSNAETYIPENLTVIGTMNTADRSIALVDAAIRRRFRHVQFAPDVAVLRAWLRAHGLDAISERAAARLTSLNASLVQLLDADRLIGHTYLMRDDLDAPGLEAVWDEDIEPVLNEHLFNQPDEVVKLREIFLG